MSSRTFVTMTPTMSEDFGLDAIAQHNATATTEQFPPYQDDAKGLGIYQNGFYEDESYLHNPPTPRSSTETDGIRTRSGRSTRGRTDSPFSTGKSRVSKSPAARSNKKEKKSKVLEKAKMPKLTAPLSVLTKDMDVPVKDIDAWVNRSAEVRKEETDKRQGYVTRPMNSFMLYRSAYAERTKQWATQNNHQVVSSVAGESWPMEPEEVRNQFNEWAKTERANHAAAHPEYKFSPSKTTKKRRGEFSDDEDDGASDLDGDPDGEYRAGGRYPRQRKRQEQTETAFLPPTVGFASHPYYEQQGYDIPQYSYTSNTRTLPSNIYDSQNITWNPNTGTYSQTSLGQHPSYAYAYSMQQDLRIPTPGSQHGGTHGQSLGGYGLPGHISSTEDLFGTTTTSRTGTPAAHYNHYGQPVYQYTHQQPQQYTPTYHAATPVQSQHHLYEHQQYLQAASQPQTAIDPSLEAALAAEAAASAAAGVGGMGVMESNQFEEAIGDIGAGGMLTGGMPEYFEESTSPNQTLAPRWEPSATDLGGGQ